jgi:hypothetical protein
MFDGSINKMAIAANPNNEVIIKNRFVENLNISFDASDAT